MYWTASLVVTYWPLKKPSFGRSKVLVKVDFRQRDRSKAEGRTDSYLFFGFYFSFIPLLSITSVVVRWISSIRCLNLVNVESLKYVSSRAKRFRYFGNAFGIGTLGSESVSFLNYRVYWLGFRWSVQNCSVTTMFKPRVKPAMLLDFRLT